jgi:HK97 family phage prohead protease
MEKKVVRFIGGTVTECKQEERDGIPVGIIAGYIATWDVDRGDDKFLPGAFKASIGKQVTLGRKNIPLKDFHGRTIGGFPIETIKEDGIGLFGRGEVNLELEQGRDAFSLAKQNVYDSFSIGYLAIEVEFEAGIRIIKESELLEGSVLDVPMNERALVTEVKAATQFKDFQLAARDRAWDSGAASGRVRAWAGAEDGLDTSEIQGKFRQGFFWYDAGESDVFSSYKLPFVDIIDGNPTAVPRGIFAAAAAMQGARGGVELPASDRAAVRRHIDRYYDKMNMDSPFEEQRAFRVDDISVLIDERVLENLLAKGVRFSQKTAKTLTAILKPVFQRDAETNGHRDGELSEETCEKALAVLSTIKLNKEE